MDYWMAVLTFALIFSSLSISYNISVGYVGMLSIAHAAFFSIGAYAYGYLGTKFGGGELFLPSVALAVVISLVIAVAVGTIITLLPEEFVVMGTFALQVIFTTLLVNISAITNGVQGLAGIPAPIIGPFEFVSRTETLILTAVLVFGSLLVAWLLLNSNIGLRARAVREEPAAALSMGVSVRLIQVSFFSIGAALASVAGSVYAGVIGFIDPSSFTIHASIQLLAMVVVGGLGNPFGAMAGGFLISVLPALLIEMNIGESAAAGIQQILFGAVMILVIMLRPSGMFPERTIARK
ncbi:MAG: branched-chain amino acid ABC transporter permease [Pseudomonadota bacterium]